MNQIIWRIFILLAVLSPGAALAQSDCTPFALEQLSKLNTQQISGQIQDIMQLAPGQIMEVQRCLKARGCYDRDPAAIDGIVRVFTGGALTRSASGRCSIRPDTGEIESCRKGNDAITWQLSTANIKALETPEKPDAGSIDASSQTETPPPAPPPPMSGELKAGLQLMQNADYFSRDLFENDLRYFTLEPITDEKVKKAATTEFDGMLPKIREIACKSHSYDMTPPAPDPDMGLNETEALSDGVYGFFPFWGFGTSVEEEQGKPEKKAGSVPTRHQVDLGVLQRIGWFGATFNNSGQLDLPSLKSPESHKIVVDEIALARRFRTNVDIIVYKKLSPAQWSEVISADPDTFINNLTDGIAKEVGSMPGGFLDSVQCWAIPSALTSSPLEWDGATLYLDGFPWGDSAALDFLKKLLRRLRVALYNRQESSAVCQRARPELNLYLVVPFDALVVDPPQPPGQQTPQQPARNPTIFALSQLIPNRKGDINLASRRPPEVDVVDSFLVFLPQSTSVNKKRLRQAIETAFNRNEDTLRAVQENVDVDLAVWRYQMLRRIIYILSPGEAKYKGDYAKPGLQLLDDMVYGKNNFAAVGFMPLPVHDGNNLNLADDIRLVFRREQRDWVERNISPIVEKVTGMPFVNFIGSRRREIFLLIELIAAVLLLYFIASRWIFELRDFFSEHKMPFIALFALGAAASGLLCLLDRNLKQLASYLLAGLVLFSAAIFGLWKYRQSKVQADLP